MPQQPPSPPEEIDGRNRPFHDPLLERLVGTWHVRGTVVGRPLEHRCEAEWSLNHQFLKVHFIDVSKGTAGTDRPRVPYEALVFIGYDNMSERYVVHWIDVFGGRFSETLGYGRRDPAGSGDNAIKFVFEYPDGPLHNTFTWNGEQGTWSILIRQKDARGRWTTFAEEILRPTETAG